MTTPIVLAIVSGESEEIDYLGELVRATEHFELGINPDGTWEQAMARIRMIGQISEQRRKSVSRSFTIPMPEGLTHKPFTFNVGGSAELYVLRFEGGIESNINLSLGTERFEGGTWQLQ